jgi:iron-sulfur cluster insertion protein
MITITESAQLKIKSLFEEEGNPDLKLRTFVQGGGCSGMQYGFTFEEQQNEDDFEIAAGDIKLLVDSISMQYLTEATVDYVEDVMGASFTIKNPNAQTTCGCGSSFSPG